MKTVFFGTPEFAVPSLEALARETSVALAVTRPDRPVGRHARPEPSAVARRAAELGIAVSRPVRLAGDVSLFEGLRAIRPDVGVVVAYGRILPKEMLAIPRLGFVNVHASLLPRHRGASPIQAALLAGDRETGVVTMRVVEELDAGPIYLSRAASIEPREDAGTLSARLAREGADLLMRTLRDLDAGPLEPRPQAGEPTYSRPISREDGEVDWSLTATELERRLRAYTPWPGLYTFLDGERLKILRARAVEGSIERSPGTLWRQGEEALAAAGGGTALALERVQRAGRRPLEAGEFLRGLPRLPIRLERSP